MPKKKKCSNSECLLSPAAFFVLRIGFPLIVLQGSALLFRVCQSMEIDPFYTYYYYAPIMEYLVMSLTLLVGGALLFDWIGRRQ